MNQKPATCVEVDEEHGLEASDNLRKCLFKLKTLCVEYLSEYVFNSRNRPDGSRRVEETQNFKTHENHVEFIVVKCFKGVFVRGETQVYLVDKDWKIGCSFYDELPSEISR